MLNDRPPFSLSGPGVGLLLGALDDVLNGRPPQSVKALFSGISGERSPSTSSNQQLGHLAQQPCCASHAREAEKTENPKDRKAAGCVYYRLLVVVVVILLS